MDTYNSNIFNTPQRQQTDDNNLAALADFLASSAATNNTHQQQQPPSASLLTAVSNGSSSTADPQLSYLTTNTTNSPLLQLSSIGVTSAQTTPQSDTNLMDALYAIDPVTLTTILSTQIQDTPTYPANISTATSVTAMPSADSDLFNLSSTMLDPQILGKRKVDNTDSNIMPLPTGAPLNKRFTLPSYYIDRSVDNSSGESLSSLMPTPAGNPIQRVTSYHPGAFANMGTPTMDGNPLQVVPNQQLSLANGGSINPASINPLTRFHTTNMDTTTSTLAMDEIKPIDTLDKVNLQKTLSIPVHHQRKVAHNAIERRYRNNINDRISDLRNSVPALQHIVPKKKTPQITVSGKRRDSLSDDEDEDMDYITAGLQTNSGKAVYVDGVAAATKLNKATILGKSTEYIYHLRRNNDLLTRETTYLQDIIRNHIPNGNAILANLLHRAKDESAVATAALYPPERPSKNPSKKK